MSIYSCRHQDIRTQVRTQRLTVLHYLTQQEATVEPGKDNYRYKLRIVDVLNPYIISFDQTVCRDLLKSDEKRESVVVFK